MDYATVLREIAAEVQPLVGSGRVANYIPPLADVPADHFGMSLAMVDGEVFAVGDHAVRFSTQSIAKLFALAGAIRIAGDELWNRVGREPSGTAFNSLVQLELESGTPRNPFINAGALVVTDIILQHIGGEPSRLVPYLSDVLRRQLHVDEAVARAESEEAWRNRALANLLRGFGNLKNHPDEVISAYCRLCAIEMSCDELALASMFLATGGHSVDGGTVVTARDAKRINAVMLTCGVYDEAGDYAYRVGLPAKSGVGGGVIAVMPGHFVAAVWSPGLSERGNSIAGTQALELLTTKTAISVF